jgi:hypothetical protein
MTGDKFITTGGAAYEPPASTGIGVDGVGDGGHWMGP